MRFTCSSTRSLSLGRLLVKLIKLYKSGLRNQKSGMVMKPVRGLFYMFLWIWRCTTFNSIPIILILLRNKNVALLYSVTICKQETKDCTPSGSFQHKLQYHCFFLFFFYVCHLYQPVSSTNHAETNHCSHFDIYFCRYNTTSHFSRYVNDYVKVSSYRKG